MVDVNLRFGAACCLCASLALVPGLVRADLFSMTLAVQGGGSQTETFRTVEDLVDVFETSSSFDTINPNYTDTSVALATLNFRGLNIEAQYPTAGPEVVFSIPDLGFSRRFDEGTTRDENAEAFGDFLEDNADGLLQDILQYLAAETPTDPVAGNPASLMSQMVAASFSMGSPIGALDNTITVLPGPGRGESGAATGTKVRSNVVGLQARFSQYSADGREVTAYSLPISWARAFQDSGIVLSLDLPLTVVEAEDATSYAASVGAGLGFPITDKWTVTPSVRAGVTASAEVGAFGLLRGLSVISNYAFSLGDWDMDLGNGVTFVSTIPLEVDDTDASYDLQNTVLRNGLGGGKQMDFPFFGQPAILQLGVINSQFFGDDLYVQNSTEFVVALASQKVRDRLIFNRTQIGLSYTVTDTDYTGFSFNFGYRF